MNPSSNRSAQNSTQTDHGRPARAGAKRWLVAIGLVVLLAVAAGVFLVGKAGLDRDRVGASLRITTAAGNDILVTLVEFEGLPWARWGRASRSVGLELIAHDPASAQPRWSYTLAQGYPDPVGANHLGFLLGYDGHQLWLRAPRLQMFDPISREAKDGVAALEHANPALQGLLTDVWEHLRFDAERRRLGFVAADGRAYLVDPATLRAIAFEPQTARMPDLPEMPTPVQNGAPEGFDMDRMQAEMDTFTQQTLAYIDQIRDDSENLESGPGKFWVRGVMVGARLWLGLYTNDELRDEQPGTPWNPLMRVYGDTARRRFVRIRLGEQRRPDGQVDLKIAKVEALPGPERVWLQGGLLRAADAKQALLLRNPDSVLVLHRNRIDALGTLQVSRVTLDGRVLWTADTGLGEVAQVFPHAETLLFTGTPAQAPSRDRPLEQLISVGTTDGRVARDTALTRAD